MTLIVTKAPLNPNQPTNHLPIRPAWCN